MTLLGLAALSLPIGAVCVATGCTSLLTVPLLIWFGLDPKVAVATNMVALTFLSLGGSLSCRDVIASEERRGMLLLLLLTWAGSATGALLLASVPEETLRGILLLVVPVAALLLFVPRRLVEGSAVRRLGMLRHPVLLLLAVYGGFFSGGYVTLVTVALLSLHGMGMLRAFAVSKAVNAVSSATASVIFAWKGLVDWRIAALLSLSMFAGGWLGGRVLRRLGEAWLRLLFLLGLGALAASFALATRKEWR
jgi:uncharacterized protein